MLKQSFFWIFAVIGVTAFGQGGLDVTVLNAPDRNPSADVLVRVVNAQIGLQRQAVTNARGKVRFEGLPTSGEYVISTPENDAFHAVETEPITLRANFLRSATLIRTPLQKNYQELTVTNSFTRVNSSNAEISSTLREEELEAIPIEGRDITRSLFRLPNVTQATGFYPEAPNVSINGANGLFTNYMIDGMDNNENFLGGQKFPMPVGFARNVTVLTNNYSTEFGRTGNGVFNITSKSGGNISEGEAFYITRPGPSIDASSTYAQRDLSGNQVQDGFRRDQFGFGLGGPIVKDRTFFYVNAEQTRDDKDNLLTSPSLGVNETVQGENEFTYISAKIDHFFTPDWSSSLRLNSGTIEIERQGGGLEGGVAFPSAGSVQDRNSALVSFSNTYVGDSWVYEGNLQYSRFRWDYGEPLGGPSPQVTVLDANGLTAAVLGHPGFVFDNLERTWQIQQKLTWNHERHYFKVGYDLISADFELLGGGNVNGSYRVQLTQQQQDALIARGVNASLGINDIPSDVQVLDYAVELQPKAFGDRQNLHSFYIEDQITVNSKLDVTLGLRYDYDSLSEGGSTSADSDNVAPRLSFNYAFDERAVIRGGAGVFYEKIPYAIYSDALQQNSTAAGYRAQLQQLIELGILPADTDLDRITFDGNLTVNPQAVSYLNGPTPEDSADLRATAFSNERRILNPEGYDNPYTYQYSLGYQRQFRDDMLFYVDLMYTESHNLLRLRDLNAPAAYSISAEQAANLTNDQLRDLVRSQSEADATRPVAPVAGGARGIIVSETAGRSHYKAANFNFIKDRGDDAYALRASYTLSRLRNNTEDINFRAENSNHFDAEWGPSINDRTHVINALATYYPLQHLSLSLAASLQSGQPINRIPDAAIFGTTDLNGDGRSFADAYTGNSDRYPGSARNSDRLPWSYTYDLGIEYALNIPRGHLRLRADVFNLFNHTNLSGYSNNATQSNQIQVGPDGAAIVGRNAAPPRQFQFTMRYTF